MGKSQYDIWFNTFKPEQSATGTETMVDGCMLDYNGPDHEHVLAMMACAPDRVWTMVEGDNGNLYISQGYHRVNRMGYIITALPYDPANPLHQKRYGQKDVRY